MTKPTITVTLDGEEFEVLDITVSGGEPRELDLAARARIARGIRKYLAQAGDEVVTPFPAALSQRQIALVQGFDVDHDAPAIHEHVRRMSEGAGGGFAGEFGDLLQKQREADRKLGAEIAATYPPGCATPVAWESPPCEMTAKKRQAIPKVKAPPTLACSECGAQVALADWDTHLCDDIARRRHQEAK